jgi:hypothetical protein
MDNPNVIADAIDKWKSLNFGKSTKEYPNNGIIPYTVTKSESAKIRSLLGNQPAIDSPFILMKKILCVLKWRHNQSKAISILEDFSESLGERPAKLII